MAMVCHYRCVCGPEYSFFVTKQKAFGLGALTPSYVDPDAIPQNVEWAEIDREEELRGEIDWAREAAQREGQIFVDTREEEEVVCDCGNRISPFDAPKVGARESGFQLQEAKVLLDDDGFSNISPDNAMQKNNQNERLLQENTRCFWPGEGYISERRAGDLYRLLVESHTDLFVRVDRQNRIVFANETACRVLGEERRDLLGTSFTEFVHAEDLECTFERLDELMAPPHRVRFEHRVKTVGGLRWMEWEDCAILDEDGRVVEIQGTGRDVTERKDVESRLEYQTAFQKMVAEISSDFISVNSANADEKIGRLLRKAGNFFGMDRSYLLCFASDGKTFTNTHEWCAHGVEPVCDSLQDIPAGDLPWWTGLIRNREVVQIDNVGRMPPEAWREQELFARQDIISLLTIPVGANGELLGALGFDSVRREKAWDNGEIALLKVLANVLADAYQRISAEMEKRQLRKEIEASYSFEDIVSQSSEMQELFQHLPDIAVSDSPVLLEGESGTGKDMVARAIHNRSHRCEKPFHKVNCGALPTNLLESELFGHKAGAFTDAKRDKPGRFERAEGGTLFLDEIGEMPKQLQVKLLQVLQDGTYEPVGGTSTCRADVRIVAATNRNLGRLVREGGFRQDLYYRINVMTLEVPPLRKRKGDVPLLVEHFIAKYNRIRGKNIMRTNNNVMASLLTYDYPGNVRELESIIEHCFVLCNGKTIREEHLPTHVRVDKEVKSALEGGGKGTLREMEKVMIRNALRRNDGNKTASARELGIDPSTLFRKLKDYHIGTS